MLQDKLSSSNLLVLRGILNNLQYHPNFYQSNQDKLTAADLAYFAHNASLDDGPSDLDDFHEDFHAFRRGTANPVLRYQIQLGLRRAIFDHAAKLDHIVGSTTLVIHIPGAMEPMTPALPEFIKANVYVPGSILRELKHNGRENPVPDIIQLLIRELGVPTVQRFERIRSRLWPFPRDLDAPKPRPLPEIQGMPLAIPKDSSRYLFYGRRIHNLPDPEVYFAPFNEWHSRSHDGWNDTDVERSLYEAGESTLDTVD